MREFQAKEKALAEEKAKRITVAEQDLRAQRAALEEVSARFDEALQVGPWSGKGWGHQQLEASLLCLPFPCFLPLRVAARGLLLWPMAVNELLGCSLIPLSGCLTPPPHLHHHPCCAGAGGAPVPRPR